MTSSRDSNDIPISRPSTKCDCGPWWRLPVLLAVVLGAILFSVGAQVNDVAIEPAGPPAGKQVQLEAVDKVTVTIDFGGEPRSLSNTVPWHKGMTVSRLLSSASLASFGQKGNGASAFLTQIAGVENEGAGGRNWMYSVNGKRADRSFAVYELQPSDHVLWSFAPPE